MKGDLQKVSEQLSEHYYVSYFEKMLRELAVRIVRHLCSDKMGWNLDEFRSHNETLQIYLAHPELQRIFITITRDSKRHFLDKLGRRRWRKGPIAVQTDRWTKPELPRHLRWKAFLNANPAVILRELRAYFKNLKEF